MHIIIVIVHFVSIHNVLSFRPSRHECMCIIMLIKERARGIMQFAFIRLPNPKHRCRFPFRPLKCYSNTSFFIKIFKLLGLLKRLNKVIIIHSVLKVNSRYGPTLIYICFLHDIRYCNNTCVASRAWSANKNQFTKMSHNNKSE